jgi:hypothetical protein
MIFTKLGAEIWRDFVTAGVPGSGAHDIAKADVRQWMEAVESALGAGLLMTTTPLDTDAISAFFASYECLGATKFQLIQAEDQSDLDDSGMRDLMFVEHQDEDLVDYTSALTDPSDRKVSNALRVFMTGKNTAGSYANDQFKDLHAGWFAAIGRTRGLRGVSGLLSNSIQYSDGVGGNECRVEQPAAASLQSTQLFGWLITLNARKGDADGSHFVRALEIQNAGKLATAAMEVFTLSGFGEAGTWQYLLKGDQATVTTAAIRMPASASGDVGTIIEYDSNDYSYYERASNHFHWIIGGADAAELTAGGFNISGGLRVGFGVGTSPTADRVEIADANFALDIAAGGAAAQPGVIFDSGDTLIFIRASNEFRFRIGGSSAFVLQSGAILPPTNDTVALGLAATSFSDLFLASGAVIGYANGDYSLTHSSGLLTASGAFKSAHATGGIGYATGAGGTVTQTTNKATGVSLNKVVGQITMDAAALAANTTVAFTLTNSAIAATDLVSVAHSSAGTAGAYQVWVTTLAAGSCVIQVRNITAGSLSEAIVLSFAVLKGVTS